MAKKKISKKRARSSKTPKGVNEKVKISKKTISRKRARSSKPRKQLKIEDFKGAKKIDPDAYITNEKNVAMAILECLQNNDPEGVMDVLAIYVDALNKARLMHEGEIPKSTFYHALRSKNPTLKTLAKFVSSSTQEQV